ncbi:MAG: hypothetical protein ACI308_01640 [Muribaculaceae bacterium]
MKNSLPLSCLVAQMLLSSCTPSEQASDNQVQQLQNWGWQTVLQEKLPLLGHRNWIVITDMAYPLQAKDGITTLYATEPYEQVLGTVKQMIDNTPHVYAHTYQDKELAFLEEDICPGIDSLKAEMDKALSGSDVTRIDHEQLITRLDSVSNLFEVVIIKTPLTKPYTSTFFELDCKYWDSDKQSQLNAKIAAAK